jgi:LmbE family N-acetylglucosaminyl deacetylase
VSEALDVLAIGAHPDDVELGCGGTLALLAQAGRRVGPPAPATGRGGAAAAPPRSAGARPRTPPPPRRRSARLPRLRRRRPAARHAEEEALIAELRRLRPELVLGPTPADRHPDHGRAHRLVADACFYAGLARRGSGKPHRPRRSSRTCSTTPSRLVRRRRLGAWEAKQRALDAYESQLHQPRSAGARSGLGDGAGDDAGARFPRAPQATKVSSPEFRLAVAGRAQHFG